MSSLGNNYCYILKRFAITSLIHSASDYFVELHLREDGIEMCAKKYGGEEDDFCKHLLFHGYFIILVNASCSNIVMLITGTLNND